MKKTIIMSEKKVEKLLYELGFSKKYGKLFAPRKLYADNLSRRACNCITSIFIDEDTSVITFKCALSKSDTKFLCKIVTNKIYEALNFSTVYDEDDFTDNGNSISCTLYYDDETDTDEDSTNKEKLEELDEKAKKQQENLKTEAEEKLKKEAEKKAFLESRIKTTVSYADYKNYLWLRDGVLTEEGSYDRENKTIVVLWDRDANKEIEEIKKIRNEYEKKKAADFEASHHKVRVKYSDYKDSYRLQRYKSVPNTYDPCDRTIEIYIPNDDKVEVPQYKNVEMPYKDYKENYSKYESYGYNERTGTIVVVLPERITYTRSAKDEHYEERHAFNHGFINELEIIPKTLNPEDFEEEVPECLQNNREK